LTVNFINFFFSIYQQLFSHIYLYISLYF